MHWQTTRYRIDLSRPRVMGIVNVTPDSFADGGRHATTQSALACCVRLVEEGADIIDIGGESTRPGAVPPGVDEELARVLPVVAGAVKLGLGVPLSVDTSEPEVMHQALELGADIINDVRALQRPGALNCISSHARAGVCLMHVQGDPATMQARPVYGDVVSEVAAFLRERASALESIGVARDRIVLDPGIGFGKTADHNIALMSRQAELVALGWPLLVGWSRKSTLGLLTGRPVGERAVASVAAALAAVYRGASVVRVHDVAATVDAIKVWSALAQPDPFAASAVGPPSSTHQERL